MIKIQQLPSMRATKKLLHCDITESLSVPAVDNECDDGDITRQDLGNASSEPPSKKVKTQINWTKIYNPVTMSMFSEEVGPNIQDTCETPVEVFLSLFPDSFINDLVFQTSLYAMQRKGGNSNFLPRTKEEHS